MIGIIGNMSGGKTYTAVSMILEAFRDGHTVLTNIDLEPDGVSQYLGVDEAMWRPLYWRIVDDDSESLPPNCVRASDYESWPSGSPRGSPTYDDDRVFIFLDEVSSIFDSMTSGASEQIKQVAAWARHTEKRGQLVFLIMQFENELHKRLRVHITEYIFCRNFNNLKIPVLRCKLPRIMRGYIARIHLAPDGETPLGRPDLATIDSRIYSCYKTAQIVVGSTNVVRAHKFAVPQDYFLMRHALLCFVVAVFASIVSFLVALCLI